MKYKKKFITPFNNNNSIFHVCLNILHTKNVVYFSNISTIWVIPYWPEFYWLTF